MAEISHILRRRKGGQTTALKHSKKSKNANSTSEIGLIFARTGITLHLEFGK